MKLSSLDPNTKVDRFLISIEQEQDFEEYSSLPKDSCKEPGRLQSMSGMVLQVKKQGSLLTMISKRIKIIFKNMNRCLLVFFYKPSF